MNNFNTFYATYDNKEFVALCNRIENYFPKEDKEYKKEEILIPNINDTINKVTTNIEELARQLYLERKEYQKKLSNSPIVLEFGPYKCSIIHNNIDYFYYDKHEKLKKELLPSGQYVTGFRANGGRGNLKLMSCYHNVPFYHIETYKNLNEINVKDLQLGAIIYLQDEKKIYTKINNTDDKLTELAGTGDFSSFEEHCSDKTSLQYQEIAETYYQWDKKDYEEWKNL